MGRGRYHIYQWGGDTIFNSGEREIPDQTHPYYIGREDTIQYLADRPPPPSPHTHTPSRRDQGDTIMLMPSRYTWRRRWQWDTMVLPFWQYPTLHVFPYLMGRWICTGSSVFNVCLFLWLCSYSGRKYLSSKIKMICF